ncbi:hypothetical protein OC195_20755 [Priestia flexa]|nr:hypothetical protein OC195_20755 [Priestia flexa]
MERSSILERVFKLSERQTTPKQEILAGLTTFMTVSYMVIVNPLILSDAGIPKEAALAATIYAIVFSTILMALWANFPIVTGPGMGLNAFFTYSVVLGQGYIVANGSWCRLYIWYFILFINRNRYS